MMVEGWRKGGREGSEGGQAGRKQGGLKEDTLFSRSIFIDNQTIS